MRPGALAEPVLVGREHELEELQRCLDSVFEGKGATVFISGEAGTGKTRLAREFLKSTREKKEVTTLNGWCLSNAAVPYLPFIEAFKSYFSQKENQKPENKELDINAWLTGAKQAEKTGSFGGYSPQAWKDLTFDAVTKALSAMAAYEPVILFVEDLHWADSASLSLVHYISRSLIAEKILVLATFRSEELTVDQEGTAHPLAEEMRVMRRENLLKEINLTNFDQTGVTQIAEDMIDGKVSAEVIEMLAKESRGNALFVVESLRMLYERGSLYLDDDLWRLSVDTLGIPDRFKDIVLRRLSMLKFNQRRVLDAASVIGEKFDVELLSVVLAQDTLEVLEALNAIARSTSLVRVEENTFRFAHAKSRQAIYEEIALPLRRGYHRRVAEKLETAVKDGRLPLSDIAYHYAESGNEEIAVKFALVAGQDSLARFGNAEAVRQFIYVLEKAPVTPENAETRRIALEGLGDAYYANCMYKKALEVFERLAGSETGEDRLRAYRKAMDAVIFGGIDFPERLVELDKKAEPYAASSRLESARVRFLGATALMLDKETQPKMIENFEEAFRVFEEEYSLPDVARTLIPLARGTRFYFFSTRRYGKGVSAFLRSIAMYEEMGDLRGLLDALYFTGEHLLFSGVLVEEARDRLTRAVQVGEKLGHYDKISQTHDCLSRLSEHLGHLEEAVSESQRAFECSALTDSYTTEWFALWNAARQYAKLGETDRAEEIFGKLSKNPAWSFARERGFSLSIYPSWSHAVLFAAKKSWKEADEWFGKAFKNPEIELPMIQMGVRRDYAWALDLQGRTEEAKAQREEIDKIKNQMEEEFAHVAVEANLMVPRLVTVGQEFEIRLDLVNASKKQGSLVKAENLIPQEFTVTMPPAKRNLWDGSVEFNGEMINPFQVVTLKARLKALRKGNYNLNPQVTYMDDLGETKTCKLEPITITVQPVKVVYEVLPNRVPMGCLEVDALLFGGIPEGYAVVLCSSASDERELLLTRFLEAGVEEGQTTFHLTAEAGNARILAEKHPTSFYLVLCNPQADFIIPELPNIYKLKGVENLTEVDIALTKAFRRIDPAAAGPRRFCAGIVSDVLLQHHAMVTRKWLSALLPNLKSKGFTVLAAVDPQMHPPEEVQAILSLFDGEIRIKEKETPQGYKQTLRVRRLYNQKFQDNELTLNKEKTEQ